MRKWICELSTHLDAITLLGQVSHNILFRYCDVYSREIKFCLLQVKCWYQNSSTYSWGWPEFVSLAKLREAYLDKEGSLKVEVEFKVVSATKYSS